MPDVTVSRTYKGRFAQRMAPAIGNAVKGIEGSEFVQRRLQRLGVEPDEDGVRRVDEIPQMKKAELLIDHILFSATLRYEDEQRAVQRRREVEDLIDVVDEDAE